VHLLLHLSNLVLLLLHHAHGRLLLLLVVVHVDRHPLGGVSPILGLRAIQRHDAIFEVSPWCGLHTEGGLLVLAGQGRGGEVGEEVHRRLGSCLPTLRAGQGDEFRRKWVGGSRFGRYTTPSGGGTWSWDRNPLLCVYACEWKNIIILVPNSN